MKSYRIPISNSSLLFSLLILVSLIVSLNATEVAFQQGHKLTPAQALEPTTVLSLLESQANAQVETQEPKSVCVRNIPNVRGLLRQTCCNNMKCGFANGVCCQGGSHCCPSGTVCVQGDAGTPPGCLHVMEAVVNQLSQVRQESASLSAGFVSSAEQPVGTIPLTASANAANAPAVIPNPFAEGIPCNNPTAVNCNKKDLPVNRIVYEDAMAPHARNAFSQYRIEKTSEHHIAAQQGQVANGPIITERLMLEGKKGYTLPPLPATTAKLSVGDTVALSNVGNSLAKPIDPTVQKQLQSNLSPDYSVQVNEKAGDVLYNLPDGPTVIKMKIADDSKP